MAWWITLLLINIELFGLAFYFTHRQKTCEKRNGDDNCSFVYCLGFISGAVSFYCGIASLI